MSLYGRGFYWVRTHGNKRHPSHWQIAWHDKGWIVLGREETYDEDTWAEVGPRLDPPPLP